MEQPLPKHGACNLGSINLSEFVVNPFQIDSYFDYEGFSKATKACIKALDQIVDENANNHALTEQKEMALKYRNCGLGVMGLYDCLAKLGMKYGSKDSIDTADEIMDAMFKNSVIESLELAKVLGKFPGWDDKVVDSTIFRKHFDEKFANEVRKYGLRNCSLLSVAPAGSIATMLNISTGCEPIFAKSYQRKTESLNDGEEKYYTVYAGIIQDYFDITGKKEVPDLFVESHDINWQDRIDLQAVLQEHVDTAISSTVNLKHDVSVDEVELLYLYAWQKGLKGVTIFRDGCARVGILTTGDNNESKSDDITEQKNLRGFILKADDNCVGKKRTLRTGCGTLHCEAFFDPDTGDLLETYFSRGSTGGCANSYTGLSRMISLAARGGVDVYSIVDQLKSSGVCPAYAVRSATKHDTSKGSSCPVAIGNALLDMYNEMQEELFGDEADIVKPKIKPPVEKTTTTTSAIPKCPQCGEELIFEGGCQICRSCGWSKCE